VVAVDHAHDKTLDPCVGDEQVGTGPQQQVRDASHAAAFQRRLDGLGVCRFDEELGRATDAERGA